MEEIVATADELRAATNHARAKEKGTLEEQTTEWLEWFSKRAVRFLKDTTSMGRFQLAVHLPYQPLTRSHERGLLQIKRALQAMLPGCSIDFMEEEEDEETPRNVWLSIDWSEPKLQDLQPSPQESIETFDNIVE